MTREQAKKIATGIVAGTCRCGSTDNIVGISSFNPNALNGGLINHFWVRGAHGFSAVIISDAVCLVCGLYAGWPDSAVRLVMVKGEEEGKNYLRAAVSALKRERNRNFVASLIRGLYAKLLGIAVFELGHERRD